MTPILDEGRNCWRVARAGRAALLVDGASYFEAAAMAMERARRSILVVGWDLHSRIRLRRRGTAASEETLAEMLDRLAARRPPLRVHLLAWDFAMLYALERETLPRVRLGHATHRHVRFRLDGDHPLGASQHQKLLVVDDAVAFVGGLDLTAARWDTPEHRMGDERRRDPGFPDYQPFHDVQMAVDGPAAACLGELARERWQRATGERLRPPPGGAEPWPETLEPDLRDVEVGIARTEPVHDGRPEVREVEQLYVDALRAARERVYIENQYLTSQRVGDVLVELLAREDGPEVVIVCPRECSGWLEEQTMGVLRARLVARLRRVDVRDRLRIYHPVLPGGRLHVHAKVSIVDEQLLRVGSANLSNRSMGLDTECDLAIEARGQERTSAAIGHFRNRLLAEHLGVRPAAVADALRLKGSLIAAVEALRRGERSLEPHPRELEAREGAEVVVAASALIDPERPIDSEEFLRRFLPEDLEEDLGQPARRSWLRIALVLAAVGVLAALWRWSPLAEMASVESLASAAVPLRESAWGPVAAVAVFTVAGMLMVPVTALIVATGLVFGGAVGFATALVGSLTTAAAGYAAGALLWRDAARRLMGRRANELSRKLASRGVLAMTALRIVPVAPFTVVNVAAGASHIRCRDYLLGTLLGMGPGVLALTLIADRVASVVREPQVADVAWIVALAVLLVGGTWGARRWLLRLSERGDGDES
jgi:phospholipase D1/2